MTYLLEPLSVFMNLDKQAPSPRPSPAEREREKCCQREGNVAKFIGSTRENPVRGNLSSLPRLAGRGDPFQRHNYNVTVIYVCYSRSHSCQAGVRRGI